MSTPGSQIQHPKRRGEWAEMCFMARAAERGLVVSKPWGESQHYDFAVEHEKCFLRVQVKSTMSRKKNSYGCTLRGAVAFYTKDDFDFLAIYIIPRDLWYIVPSAVAVTGRQRIYLMPDYPGSIYEPYRENWDQMKQKICIRHKNTDLCFRHGCLGRLAQEMSPPTPPHPTKLSS
jgi:hypothetical protein